MTMSDREVVRVLHESTDGKAADEENAVLIVAIHEEPSLRWPVRFVSTYKADQPPADPELCTQLAGDLRRLADELEQRGWAEAFRNG